MTDAEQQNLATLRRYFDAIAKGPSAETLDEFYAEDVVQEEFPNRLLPNGARRDLKALKEADARGRALMAAQSFEVVHMYASGHTVIVESIWTGTIGAAVGPFQPGMTMRARFAQFFELRDGKIVAVRNYDCFDPF
jgi:ketosteroid isomerase-like protein